MILLMKTIKMNKQLINHILSNGGKLKEGETWFSLGEKFGIMPPDPIRAKKL